MDLKDRASKIKLLVFDVDGGAGPGKVRSKQVVFAASVDDNLDVIARGGQLPAS